MQGTCMIKRAIELSLSNINLNVALIGFIGFRGSEPKVELWRMDNSFRSEAFSCTQLEKSTLKTASLRNFGVKYCSDRIRV